MDLGQKLLDLRKSKNLSQEEAAEKLNVTRQTISKWETNQSTPDFDKIVPICNLYGIDTNELLSGDVRKVDVSGNVNVVINDKKEITKKRAGGIAVGVLLYILSVAWIVFSVAGMNWNPVVSTAVFLVIIAIATFLIVYTCMVYSKEKTEEEKKKNKLRRQIEDIIALITLIIYLFVSFATGAWHITWLMWVVFGLISEVLKLFFLLGGEEDEK